MTDARHGRQFCSCSELPPHLRGMALSGLADTEDAIDESCGVEDEAIGSGAAGTERVVQFCNCAKVPAHISNRGATGSSDQVQTEELEETPRGAAETSSEPLEASRFASQTDRRRSTDEYPDLGSVSDLMPDESSVSSAFTHGEDGSEVVLTERRVLLRGAPDAAVLHASMRLDEIDSVVISRARPRRRSLIWGLVGIGASIGMWQALDGVGNLRLIIAAVVLMTSCVLLADYFLRPPGLDVVMRARSGKEMRVEFAPSNADEADRFAARVVSRLEAAD